MRKLKEMPARETSDDIPAITPLPAGIADMPPKSSPAERLQARALSGLGKRVGGFTSREVKTTYEIDGLGERCIKNEVVTRKQHPPDLSAIIFTLTNLDGERWRAKPPVENTALSDNDVQPDLSALSDEALQALLKYFPK